MISSHLEYHIFDCVHSKSNIFRLVRRHFDGHGLLAYQRSEYKAVDCLRTNKNCVHTTTRFLLLSLLCPSACARSRPCTQTLAPRRNWCVHISAPLVSYSVTVSTLPSIVINSAIKRAPSLSTMCGPIAIDTQCLALSGLLPLSSAEDYLCRGEVKRKRAGYDGKGKRAERRLFPLPIVPRSPAIFRWLLFLLGYPARASEEEIGLFLPFNRRRGRNTITIFIFLINSTGLSKL